MARIMTMTNTPLAGELLLIGGSSFPFKVSGLGPDKQHLLIKCDSASVTVTVVKADPKNIEQTLRLEVAKTIAAASKAKLTAYQAGNGQVDASTSAVAVSIEPRLDLPAVATDEGIVSRMLLVENITPMQPGFTSSQQSLTAMQNMLWVLKNRMALGSHHFGTSGDLTSFTAIIKAKNQVDGFENYPAIATGQSSRLDDIVKIANDSSHGKCAAFREFVRNALDVAKGTKAGADPCPTRLYGWRTVGTSSPGPNFVKFTAMGGQDFYTLSAAFLKSVGK